jgi:hypothetical protein
VGRGYPGEFFEVRRFIDEFLNSFEHRVRCEGNLGFRIVRDCLDSFEGAITPRGIDRNGYNTGVETTEKGSDELQAGGIQQQGSLPAKIMGFEPSADGPGAPVEFPIGYFYDIVLTVNQVREGDVVALVFGPVADQLNEGGWTEKSPWQVIQRHDDSSSR